MRLPYIDVLTSEETDARIVAAEARLDAAIAQLVTQTMLAQALAPLAVRTDVATAIAQAVTAAVAPLATREQVETAKQQAITQATNGRPNYTAMRNEIAVAIAPLVARIAALEAR